MAVVSMKQLLEAGVHFGHQTRRWNPKMRPYIFGARNGIHIIDLQQTVKLFRVAYDKVVDTVANGGKVLFIGTKRQAQEAVATEATKANQYYVTNRWMGGTLTNFVTIQKSVERLKKLEGMFADGSINRYQKKEILLLEQGQLDVLVKSETTRLNAGDTTVVQSNLPHIISNPGDTTAVGLAVFTPAIWFPNNRRSFNRGGET